jgi:hypothetical protein
MRFFGKLGAEPVVRGAWVGDGTVFYCTAAAAAEPGPVVSRRSPYRSAGRERTRTHPTIRRGRRVSLSLGIP